MITLVRHGRTSANASGLLLGRLDPPLDEVGEAQARAAAAWLAARPVVPGSRPPRVVSSPLLRTRSTAAAIAERLGVDVEVDESWIELDYGEWDGLPLGSVSADTWAQWRADPDFCPPGGECLSAVGRRVRAACAAIGEEDVVVVSHVSPIKAAVAWALGAGDETTWRLFLAPGSVSRVAIRGGLPSVHLFNHVPDDGRSM